MILPSRPPRNEPTLEAYNYYDHEKVVQEDGRIAAFSFQSKKRNEGWKFVGYQDKHGFHIWEEKDRVTAYAQLLLDSKCGMLSPFEVSNEGIQGDEIGYHYEYGEIMAQRGGIIVVKQSDPNTIIRSKQTWLS